jgi:hypothetical protein
MPADLQRFSLTARTRAIRHSSTPAPLAGISGSHWRIPKILIGCHEGSP